MRIFFLVSRENKKKIKVTNKNLKAKAENGSLLSIIGFVVINAEDQIIINKIGKILITINQSY